jgi:hypothetical protein
MSERHTSVREYSWLQGYLLPTLTGSTYGSNKGGAAGRKGKERLSLQTMAKRGLLPTLKASDADRGDCPSERRRRSPCLVSALTGAGLMPTLTATDANRCGRPQADNGVRGPTLDVAVGGALNPRFAEWFMGFAPGHVEPKSPPSDEP